MNVNETAKQLLERLSDLLADHRSQVLTGQHEIHELEMSFTRIDDALEEIQKELISNRWEKQWK